MHHLLGMRIIQRPWPLPEYVANRPHPKRRIHKKWLKKYGSRPVWRYNPMEMLMDKINNILYVYPEGYAALERQTRDMPTPPAPVNSMWGALYDRTIP